MLILEVNNDCEYSLECELAEEKYELDDYYIGEYHGDDYIDIAKKQFFWIENYTLFQLSNCDSTVYYLEEGILEELLWFEFMQALIN